MVHGFLLLYQQARDLLGANGFLKQSIILMELLKDIRLFGNILWWALAKHGVSSQYITFIQDMYEGVRTSMGTNGGDMSYFPITIGVHQGSALSPYLFIEGVNAKLELWKESLESKGFRLSRSKTEYMHCDFSGQGRGQSSTIQLGGEDVPRCDSFRYKMERLTRMSLIAYKRDGKNGEKQPKQQEHKVKVVEMRMLRWSSGLTLKDKVQNKTIRSNLKVAPIDEKIREGRLRWFRHVRRRPIDAPVRKCEDRDIGTERRGRGRPRLTWERVTRKDLDLLDILEDLVEERGEWRRSIHVADAL
ncbi:uncharacterized protein [Rutidosis leptorrhynchoides]|uniref:uncharacterized protein n=1 Tax=Rutidosis leptorrhynchoides TaxID=125765 RepID=UPI003A994E9E